MNTVTQEMLCAAVAAFRADKPPIDAMFDALSAAMEAKASAAPEQAPTIFAIHGAGQQVDETCELALLDEASQYEPECVTALYTHPGAEIERLRAENKRLLSAGQALEADFSSYRREVEHKAEAFIQRADAAERKLGDLESLICGLIGSTGKKRGEYLAKLESVVLAKPAKGGDGGAV